MTAQSRRKTVTPSPLSQSTSAVHLHAPDTSTIHIPRKLSKRRSPALGNIFGGPAQEPARNAISLPATPVERIPYSTGDLQSSQLPKRMSVAHIGPSSTIQSHEPTPKKEKRGSVLGRLVKKFSIMRKSAGDQDRLSGREEDWQHVNTDNNGQRLDALDPPAAPEKPQSVISKRVPPPSIDNVATVRPSDKPREPRDVDRSSSISLEAPFSMGRLTIANPDAPSSTDTTPVFNETPLPPESTAYDSYGSTYLAYNAALEREPQTPPQSQSPTNSLPNVPPLVQSPLNSERNYSSLPPSSNIIKDASTISSMGTSGTPRSPEPQSPALNNTPQASFYRHVAPPSDYFDSPSTSDSQIPGPPTERSMAYSPKTVSSSNRRPSSTESRTFRPSEKPQVASSAQPKARPPSFTPSVPFPTTQPTNGHYLAPEEHYSYDNSPLSAASMLANPPTPYTDDMSMPATPEQPPPPLPSKPSQERKPSSHESSSSNHAMGRQTETFKLIRSSSGNVYASSETIVAGGQQWEVVESMDNKGKGKAPSKPKEPEMSSRRDQRREGKSKVNGDIEIDSRHRSQRRSQRQLSGERATPTDKAVPRPTGNDLYQKVDAGAEVRSSTTKSSRKRDEERKSDRKPAEKPSIPINVNKPQPAPPPPTPGAPPRPLQRNPSISARPTSELPSAAEMNALRAKEAWEMERLWKARSMYGDDANSFGNTAGSANAPPSKSDNAQDTMHGSSHTAFVVQTPFQGQPSQIYHSMPTSPPQIIYSSPSSMSNSHQHLISPSTHQSFTPDYLSSDRKSLTSSLRPALANPLPEPPRESSYEPAPIPPSILDIGSKPTDYWTKYTGVATSN